MIFLSIGLPRRNTVCCLTDQEIGNKATYGTEQALSRPGISDANTTKGSTMSHPGLHATHALRRRSRSVGDNPDTPVLPKEQDQILHDAAQGNKRPFGVFDKRFSSASSSGMTALWHSSSDTSERKSSDQGNSNPLEKYQLTKLPNQLVSECRKLGSFLRSLSSKSWSSSCDESMEPIENLESDRIDSANDEVPEPDGNLNDGNEIFDSINRECSIKLKSNTGAGNNCTRNACVRNKDPLNEHLCVNDACKPFDTNLVFKCGNKQQLQKTIIEENINTSCSEVKNISSSETNNAAYKLEHKESYESEECKKKLNLRVPSIRKTDMCNQNQQGNEENTQIMKTKKSKQTLKVESDYSDGYATDVDYSPFGCRTPVGQIRTPECLDYHNSAHDIKQLEHSIITSYQSLTFQSQTHSEASCADLKTSSVDYPTYSCVPCMSTNTGFKHCDNKMNNTKTYGNPSDDASPELEMKSLEKPKSYLRVLTPVLISSSADESDGMSPGNLSPCSWYTGATSGESDGPGSMPKEQALNFIALDKVCFGQGKSDGQMQLQKWVESQQSWNFDSHSSHEDLSVNVPKYTGRTCRSKQTNSALRKGILPHIQVHALRDLDVKTHKSDPYLPNAPNAPHFVVSAETENPRVRAFSDVSVMDNQRNCRYSDSVFSDTLRTPSIATPCLRTPSSGGGPSDYNTSTEVLFAPSDLADNNEGCFDNDSVFTPDYEKDCYVKNIVIKDPLLQKAEASVCTEQNPKKRVEEIASKTCNTLMKRQRKRKNSISEREPRRISSSDSESQNSLGIYQKISSNSNEKTKSAPLRHTYQYQQNNDFNPIRSMLNKIAGIFSYSQTDDDEEDQLLSDAENQKIYPSAEMSLNIKISVTKKETVLSSDEEDDLEEMRFSERSTASSSLTQSPNVKQSWSDCSKDNSSLEENGKFYEMQTLSESENHDSLEENQKLSFSSELQKNKGSTTLKDSALQNILPDVSTEAVCTKDRSLNAIHIHTKENRQMDEQEKSINKSLIKFLIEKWSQLFSDDQSRKNSIQNDDSNLSKLFGPHRGSSCINQKAESGINTNLTGAKRPKTLDFSSKRPRMRGKKKISVEKCSVILAPEKQPTRKIRKSQKQQLERRLSLVAALNLLSEGACEESFVGRLDESAAAVFQEMRNLNFAVREFPRSSLENADASTTENCIMHKGRYLEKEKNTTISGDALLNISNTKAVLAVSNENVDGIQKVQPSKNSASRVKSHGMRRFSDSTAAQRVRRTPGMVHLKPPNWTFGYSASPEDETTYTAINSEQMRVTDPRKLGKSHKFQNETNQLPTLPDKSDGQCSSLSPRSFKRTVDETPSEMKFDIKIKEIAGSQKNDTVSHLSHDNTATPAYKIEAEALNNENTTENSKLDMSHHNDLKHAEILSELAFTQNNPSGNYPIVNTLNVKDKLRISQRALETGATNIQEQQNVMKKSQLLKESEKNKEQLSSVQELKSAHLHQASTTYSNLEKHIRGSKESKQSSSEELTSEDSSLSRYYHVFRQGELDGLIKEFVPTLSLIDTYYDHSNWCIIAKKN